MLDLFRFKRNTPEQRKQRSEKKLKRKGITVASHLPVTSEKGQQLRKANEIFDRVTALWEVVNNALEVEDADKEISMDFLKEIDARNKLTPLEQRFLAGERIKEQELMNLTWRTEEIKVLYWVLNELAEMGEPITEAEDVIFTVSERLIKRTDSLEKARNSARVRNHTEVLDMLDYIYRLHWAARNHRTSNTGIPASYQLDIIMEWDAALVWVTSPEIRRDEITTDT